MEMPCYCLLDGYRISGLEVIVEPRERCGRGTKEDSVGQRDTERHKG